MRAIVAGAAAMLIAGCASTSPPTAASLSIVGVVLSAPTCPVQQAGKPCPPRPVDGASVVALRDGDVVASTRTDERGRFRLRLGPGRYLVRATNVGGYASTAQRAVVARAGGPAQLVRLVVDSGIR